MVQMKKMKCPSQEGPPPIIFVTRLPINPSQMQKFACGPVLKPQFLLI